MSSFRRMRGHMAGALLALGAAGLASASAIGATPTIGRLLLCTYVSNNANNSTPTENVKIQASGGKGHIGTVTIQGAGLNHTSHFTLSKTGIAITPFEVSNSGTATITVKLARLPAKTRTIHVTLSTASTATQANCTLH